MSLSQLLIYAVSVLFGVKTIIHMEALPHLCSNLKAHLTRPLAVFRCQQSPGAWNKAGLSWEQKEHGLEHRVYAQGPQSGPGSYFGVMLPSDKFSKSKSHCRGRCCYS